MAETTQRNEFEDIITAIIGGGLKGYSSGRQSELELRKEMWKEKFKQQLQTEQQQKLIQQFGGGKAKYSISPSGLTATPMT